MIPYFIKDASPKQKLKYQRWEGSNERKTNHGKYEYKFNPGAWAIDYFHNSEY